MALEMMYASGFFIILGEINLPKIHESPTRKVGLFFHPNRIVEPPLKGVKQKLNQSHTSKSSNFKKSDK
jgi:hypothetical protein